MAVIDTAATPLVPGATVTGMLQLSSPPAGIERCALARAEVVTWLAMLGA